jgi:hypothetical protein
MFSFYVFIWPLPTNISWCQKQNVKEVAVDQRAAGGFSMDFSLFSMAPAEIVHLEYIAARRENGGKGVEEPRPL